MSHFLEGRSMSTGSLIKLNGKQNIDKYYEIVVV